MVTLSDHRLLYFEVTKKEDSATRATSTRRYNTGKANWERFRESLQSKMMEKNVTTETILKATTKAELEHITATYLQAMTEAADEAIPRIPAKKKIKLIKWWTAELTEKKAEVIKWKRKIQKANPRRRPFVIEDYIKIKEAYKELILNTMTKSWKDFCSSENKENIWQRSYRVMKLAENSVGEKLLRAPSGNATLDPRGSAKLLSTTFYPKDDEGSDNHSQQHTRAEVGELIQRLEQSAEVDEREISEQEVQTAYTSMSPKRAPGEDGLTSDICYEAHKVAPTMQTCIFNQCLKIGHFPKVWKTAKIRVIPKPGKEDYSNPKAYRPIGLLSVIGKVLEKILSARLTWTLGINGQLSARQYGFTAQKGTEDALYDAVNLIRLAIKKKQITAVVSLDIEGAFDNCWWPGILKQLSDKGIGGTLLRIVASYLSERQVKLEYMGETVSRDTNKGCVQGSVCGPLFWNIQLDPLLQSVEGLQAHVQAFADDILIIASADSETELEAIANEALEAVASWGQTYKMRFAAHKTQAMIVTKRLKYRMPILCLNGHTLQYDSSLKVLGLTIDRSLTFKPHLENTLRKVVNIYKVMSRAVKTHWGLNSEIVRLLYLVVIEPTVLYAASTWAPGCDFQYNRNRLDRITRMFALKISRAHRTTSLTSSILLAQILPLYMRAREQASLYEIKRGKPIPEFPGRSLQKPISPYELPHPSERKGITFGLVNNQQEVNDLDTGNPRLFTDGSKIEGKVGAAVSVWTRNNEIKAMKLKLADYCTVYQAEMAAIEKALTYLLGAGLSGTILSDSRSALEALSDPNPNNPIAVHIQRILREMQQRQLGAEFFWVRAHVGIDGNERADELAKNAALKMKTAPSYSAVPLSCARRTLRRKTIEDWQSAYSAAETGKITKMFFPNVEEAYKILRKIGITAIRTQIFSGHCGLKAYLHRFKLSPDPFCTCDGITEETIFHILLDCPKYALRRYDCECRMDTELKLETITTIMSDNNLRPMLLAFAEPTLREAAKANGAKVF